MARRVADDTLLVRWCEQEQDFRVWYPRSCDGGFALSHIVNGTFTCTKCFQFIVPIGAQDGRSFVEELEARGYDPKTLRFTIKRKKQS